MLTDLALKRLKPQEKTYKIPDRDGMYAAVSPAGQTALGTTIGRTDGARR